MKLLTALVLLQCCIGFGHIHGQPSEWAKLPEADALLVVPFYSSEFKALPHGPEEWVAKRLFKYDMQELVDEGVIHRDDMKGLALPLGIHNKDEEYFVDFSQGMLDMWREKAKWAIRKGLSLDASVMLRGLDFVEVVRFRGTRSNIRSYRSKVLSPAIEKVKVLHNKEKSAYSKERQEFMDIFLKNFSPNVMLGYNIQELVPPTHMVGKSIYSMNPLFKAYYLDLILKEGGMEVFEGFPARYDKYLSHGPFQMTDFAFKGILGNKRLFDSFKSFKSVQDLQSIHDHAFSAAVFAYYNWEMLSFSLKQSGLISKFNQYFGGNLSSEKSRSLSILIGGLTACMHHQPTRSRRMIAEALKAGGSLSDIHYSVLASPSADKQLKKYYRSAAEAYLVMKIYHKLEEEYGGR